MCTNVGSSCINYGFLRILEVGGWAIHQGDLEVGLGRMQVGKPRIQLLLDVAS